MNQPTLHATQLQHATWRIAEITQVFLAALVWDLLLGEPSNRWHPVAWMGNLIAWAQRRAPVQGQTGPFLAGMVIVAGGALAVGVATAWLERALQAAPWYVRLLCRAYLFKSTFSVRGLWCAAQAVHDPLVQDDLLSARQALAWHLVSRDTGDLTAGQVAAATIESVAENTSDGIVAPWFFFALGGLPIAAAYRYISTVDAMLGYRDAAREWLGKVGARLDDAANFAPARLTALLYLLAAAFQKKDVRLAAAIWARDAGRTASPNAGHPMSAVAGALDVELEKVGHYRLGAGLSPPVPQDIPRMSKLFFLATGLAVLLYLAVALAEHESRRSP